MPTKTTHPGAQDRAAPDKLSVIVFTGDFAKVHYALVLASAAAAVGTPATLFFTMGAAAFLARPCDDGTPGWRALPAGESGGGESGQACDAGGVDEGYRSRGVATFEELLAACADLGVRVMVCEMGLRAMGLHRADLRDDIPIAEGGVVTFLADASRSGAMVFV